MKLLQILARDLSEWPVGDCGCDSITQEGSGELNATEEGKKPLFLAGAKHWTAKASSFIFGEGQIIVSAQLANDYATAIVTREQWEAERQRGTAWRWTEDGLPQIGAKALTKYGEAKVIAISRTGENVCIEWDDGEIGVMMTSGLRQIQTERELAIDAIRTFSGDKVTKEMAGLMYDKGFMLK